MSVVSTIGTLLLTSSGEESVDFGCAADPMALQGIYPEFIGWTEKHKFLWLINYPIISIETPEWVIN